MNQEILDYLLLVENMVHQHRIVKEMIMDGAIGVFNMTFKSLGVVEWMGC